MPHFSNRKIDKETSHLEKNEKHSHGQFIIKAVFSVAVMKNAKKKTRSITHDIPMRSFCSDVQKDIDFPIVSFSHCEFFILTEKLDTF